MMSYVSVIVRLSKMDLIKLDKGDWKCLDCGGIYWWKPEQCDC